MLSQSSCPCELQLVLTQALSNGLEVDAGQAEHIKRTLGLATQVTSADENQAVEIIYEVSNEQLSSLRNTINYFVNTRPGTSVRQIVLSGGGAYLLGFPDALAEITRIPVVAGDPFSTVAVAKSLDAEHLKRSAPGLTVALGLALGSVA